MPSLAYCEVDGEAIPIETVEALHQNDPYPGGHRYHIEFANPSVRRLFREFADGEYEFNRDDTSSLFFSLSTALGISRSEEGPLAFLLNTIERLTLSGDRVRIEGICSEFVKGSFQ